LSALRIVLKNIRNDCSLWDKAHLILDRDLLTDLQAKAVIDALERSFGLRVNFWEAHCVEAVLLSGGAGPALARVFERVGVASHLPNLIADAAEEACMKAWATLGVRLQASWDQLDLQKLHGVLDQRLKLLNEVLGELQNTVCEFHRSAVASERYWESADKNDVADFISEAFQHMGVPADDAERWRDGPNWLQAVVSELKSVPDFPALQSMREDLRRASKLSSTKSRGG